MDTELCDVCGRKCDGVHNNKITSKEKEIQKIVNMIESYGEKMVDEIIKKINENRREKNNIINQVWHYICLSIGTINR